MTDKTRPIPRVSIFPLSRERFRSRRTRVNMPPQVRKGLVELLRALLDRASVNLLYLTATFLKKLSVGLSPGPFATPPPPSPPRGSRRGLGAA